MISNVNEKKRSFNKKKSNYIKLGDFAQKVFKTNKNARI